LDGLLSLQFAKQGGQPGVRISLPAKSVGFGETTGDPDRGGQYIEVDTPHLRLRLTIFLSTSSMNSATSSNWVTNTEMVREVSVSQPNLLSKSVITSVINVPPMVPGIVYDKTSEIKWLWPRITRAGVIAGKPQPSGNRLKVPLRKTHGKPFVFGDIVRIRETPVLEGPSADLRQARARLLSLSRRMMTTP
jgi:hypothetical protein